MTTDGRLELTMRGIVKSFAGVAALRGVDFAVRGGEIHALLGANGAGKSTLMKILSGAYTADAGEIAIGGAALAIRTPRDAMDQGIACVYQEVDTALVPELTVTENVMLDRIVRGKGAVRWSELHREAERILEGIGAAGISVRRKADELSIAQKQLVLIARAAAQQAKVLIFDEPTAPLSLEEANRLFAVMRRLRDEGVACIFISHRLGEVFELCDRITVMRDGARVETVRAAETNPQRVIEAMLGKPFEEEFPKAQVEIGETLLEVRGIRRGTKVRGVDLTVRRGEIVAVAGLVGAGKTELSRLIAGADRADGGEIVLHGRRLSLSEPRDAIRAGIVLVPEERRKQGVLVEETVRTNLSLPSLRALSSPLGFIRAVQERRHAESIVAGLGIVPPRPQQQVKLLSGGNQQKVAVGKWLPTDADVYLFDEPTKGVDVGAKSDMFRLIGELAAQGKGIVYFSCELAEVLGIADRIVIMSYGRIVKELSRGEATQENILYYASAGEADRSATE
ncbi:ABC transporter [Gordoniibacillus kamchatkensis]|uniref:ABC transporter n=1 Tax=Gordoniibacillus kamchatkensis TaxID=1590651 RepID=A0ABR5ANK6_9BACL|nr:sugar ABC transporter ATP-binding protein [Paenibacillus sp. VKM B-2647]KIL42423.1 ABC transporter [Paenibacillus sp. VKM B-2647]